jgi:phosphopantothenoylcysteine decarboxylase/phosphopantothenate--cysteine ligase
MLRILITSGPTREYLDPVRYLSNASSGRMGAALAAAAVEAGHRVVIVSGPVQVKYPSEAEVISVVSTEEMLAECQKIFPACDGLIAAAAPCDYRSRRIAPQKIRKTGGPLTLDFVETPDIVATLAAGKTESQWIVAFALETEDSHDRAIEKIKRKLCDWIVVNGPAALHADETQVEIFDKQGRILGGFSGEKSDVARQIVALVIDRI